MNFASSLVLRVKLVYCFRVKQSFVFVYNHLQA